MIELVFIVLLDVAAGPLDQVCKLNFFIHHILVCAGTEDVGYGPSAGAVDNPGTGLAAAFADHVRGTGRIKKNNIVLCYGRIRVASLPQVIPTGRL